MKRIFTTPWNSMHAACTTVLLFYSEVMLYLENIIKDENLSKQITTQALGLIIGFAKFGFIAALKICVTIFEVLTPAPIWLQGIMIDFGSGTKITDDTGKKLK